jgi:DHA3 family macrolide efflux protein-like MFS transporter
MGTFYLLLVGGAISRIGTHLTAFALGVWVYQKTGSITAYSSIVLSCLLPGIAVSPLAGVLTDRWDRRLSLLVAHAGGGVCALAMALAYRAGALTLGLVVPLLMAKAAFETMIKPAFGACVAALVPRDRLDRANGLVQLGDGVSQFAAPALAGILLLAVGLGGIFLIDLATFVYAVVVLVLVRVPRPEAPTAARRSARSLLHDAAAGVVYLRDKPGLVGLLVVGALVSFSVGTIQLLFTPLVLTFANARVLGLIDSIGGIGLAAGSGVLMLWGGPRNRIAGLLWFIGLQGAIMLIVVAKPSSLLAGVGSFGVLATVPFIAGSSQTIWQRIVPLELQGRVFALRTMVGQAVYTLASVGAGPIANGLFEPWMSRTGALSGALGPLLGVGPGRGVALLIATLGLVVVATAALAWLYPPLRTLGAEVGPHARSP